jgi:hypothetical protein
VLVFMAQATTMVRCPGDCPVAAGRSACTCACVLRLRQASQWPRHSTPSR